MPVEAPHAHAPDLSRVGIVGDRHSAALVRDGEVVWWCPRRFDAPSVCASLLAPGGGRFRLAPDGAWDADIRYEPDTNVLCTTWSRGTDRLVVHDLMPLDTTGRPLWRPGSLLRIATCTSGQATVQMDFAPRAAYGSRAMEVEQVLGGGMALIAGGTRLSVQATRTFGGSSAGCTGRWHLEEGASVAVLAGEAEAAAAFSEQAAQQALERTMSWWRAWLRSCRYQGEHREAVERSALTVELLTYEPTGALVAAPTTSLPEYPGSARTWDYRYTWIRDTAFAVDAYQEAGHEEEALGLAGWIHRVLRAAPGAKLDVMYRVDGTKVPEERVLEHLEGDVRPVRIGNGAAGQSQLDVYGELVECLHLCRRLSADGHEERDWPYVRQAVEHVCAIWQEPDQGIWELRGPPRHHVLSKVMAWVALDRGVQAVEDLGLPAPVKRWRDAAQEVRASVLRHGFDSRRGTFVQSYGSSELDAANLLIPILGFLPGDDERVLGTIEAVREELEEDGLVHRYRCDDGMGPQAPLVMCSAWLVEALAQAGRLNEADDLMRRLVARATTLGLFAQNVATDGRAFGNFPLAFSHVSLMGAAVAIERAKKHAKSPSPHALHSGRGWAQGA